MKPATFVFDIFRKKYIPANKNATAVTAIISKKYLTSDDMVLVRLQGYEPLLLNGQPIGRVDIKA